MAEAKRYFWLKLKEDFFDEKYIKALRRLPQGDSLVIVYLKMQLKSLKTEGIIKYEGILPDSIAELSLALDEDENIVKLTIEALVRFGVVERWENDTFYMVAMQQLIGSETQAAARVRKHRENRSAKKDELPPPKTNAERQRGFRAKKSCEEKQHIPFIEDYINNKRYGGNYYIVIKRDKFKCAICGSIENLCVHHIDGYDENKPENNAENKMVTLCRACHSVVHAGTEIPPDVLDSIDYYVNSNEMLPCNADVTNCNTEIEKEKDIEIEKEKEKKKKATSRFIPPTIEEVKAYCLERKNNVDPERFIDYYTSNGWVVGKNKMKDWKAAVRTWERNNYSNSAPKANNTPQLVTINGKEYEYRNGKYYEPKGNGIAVDPYAEDDLPF